MRCVYHPVDFVCIQQPLPSWMQAEVYKSLLIVMCAGGLRQIQQFLGVVNLSVPADSTASEAQHFGEIFTHHYHLTLFPCSFLVALPSPRLTATHRERDLLEMALAIPRVCFSINTTV